MGQKAEDANVARAEGMGRRRREGHDIAERAVTDVEAELIAPLGRWAARRRPFQQGRGEPDHSEAGILDPTRDLPLLRRRKGEKVPSLDRAHLERTDAVRRASDRLGQGAFSSSLTNAIVWRSDIGPPADYCDRFGRYTGHSLSATLKAGIR